jgi:sigma-B regulation protein RsbU (phosphoserine phosphatase)
MKEKQVMPLQRLQALRPTSLKQKTALFILLPTFLIMFSIGGLGMRLVRQVLLEQWQETAITKLQRSAHYVDMRLMRPKEMLRFLQQEEGKKLHLNEIQLLLDQLRSLDGVVRVNHEWYNQVEPAEKHMGNMPMQQIDDAHRLGQLTISPPRYNTELLSETVSLYAIFHDTDGNRTGYIEVILSFYDLIDQIVKSPWWKSNLAFIIDQQHNILTSTALFSKTRNYSNQGKFGESDALERDTLQAMQINGSGTVFGTGMPPDKVSGYYRLTEAPWTLVIIAPGRQVLQPILEFRTYYYLISGSGILIALLYILLVTEKTTQAIKRLSKAAEGLAQGTFAPPLAIESHDEVGTLTSNFNVMTQQLQERMQLQQAMSIAREVQQNLLPQKGFSTNGLEVSGITLYCDETGGDYVDILQASRDNQKVTVVVGDVVGHGIGAAILMATVRALLRGRACKPGTLAEIADDVNRLLCRDTSYSGNFVTLFYLEIDRQNRYFNWVRCGHEPAIVYYPHSNSFHDLRGEGLVLGFDATYSYSENTQTFSEMQQLILVGSDGVWDVENIHGEQFGRDRVKTLLALYHDLPAEAIIEKITDQIHLFQAGHPQNDDITLAIIKTW